MKDPPPVAGIGVSQDSPVAHIVKVGGANEPAVAVVVMSVVSVVSVVVTAEVVAHLVYGGVVGVRTALLHRGESVAAARGGRVGVATA